MGSKLGALPEDASFVLDNPHGVPPVPSPFFPVRSAAKLPPELDWLHNFKQEIIDDALKSFSRRVYKTRAPHWIEPPFQHTVIDRQVRVNVPALAVNAVILQLVVSQDDMARIRFYAQDIAPVPPAVLPVTAWQDVVWTFRVNGTPLTDYNLFTGQRGVLGLGPAETTIVLDGSDLFEIIVTNNNAANAFWITAAIRGWNWSTLSTQMPKEDILNYED